MLQDTEEIDMKLTVSQTAVMLTINDFTPWSEPDADERLNLLDAKLKRYARYIGSKQFAKDYSGAQLIVISVLTVTPPSPRMLEIKTVQTQDQENRTIVVSFGDDPAKKVARKKPWWKFW
jgi:hypothetical protein